MSAPGLTKSPMSLVIGNLLIMYVSSCLDQMIFFVIVEFTTTYYNMYITIYPVYRHRDQNYSISTIYHWKTRGNPDVIVFQKNKNGMCDPQG